jgi:hypothetical protein
MTGNIHGTEWTAPNVSLWSRSELCSWYSRYLHSKDQTSELIGIIYEHKAYMSSYEWKYYECTWELRDWTAYVRASFLNLRISQTMRQKLGFNMLAFCAKRLEIPLPLPHSHPRPPLSDCVLTEKDMSDLSMSTPSPSNHSTMWGYVTYIFWCILAQPILVRNKKNCCLII